MLKMPRSTVLFEEHKFNSNSTIMLKTLSKNHQFEIFATSLMRNIRYRCMYKRNLIIILDFIDWL